MIVRSRPSFKDVAFALNGSILPRIFLPLVVIAIISLIAIATVEEHRGIFARMSAIPFTLIGIALSVFMSFRSSTCYARWWEGRRLWGALIIACRSFSRQTSTLTEDDQRFLFYGLCGFAAGLAARLRRQDEVAAIKHWCDIGDASFANPNPTNAVLHHIGKHCLTLMHKGRIEPIHYSVLEHQITALSDVQAGCERIASTPVPFAYSLLLHRTAIIFCVTLPFSLAGSLAWWTLLPVLLVAYTFFGLDALAHQLEDPFVLGPNCLPLDAMRRIVERDLLSLLGVQDLPPPITPQNYVLT